ncbi:MAG: PLP-dependent aminotransferase family protein [Chloroflexi bacterium CFX4]|nr:PLP-dependent aminotransferase family protein [Chloroflexi bacterium CFX4]MDL1922140.1 PLP-dependent aminotransferase family protein [Chloroflexi bacterium CFX3]
MARSAHIAALFSLDKSAAEPLYRQLIRAVREGIAEGALRAGDKLPPSRELAAQLGISRMSVVNAYAELLNEGVLAASPGRGTFIAGSLSTPRDPSALPSVAANPSAGSLPPEALIAFSGGAPAEEFLPVAAIRRSIEAVLERDGAAAVAYEETEGYPPLRAAVAEHLASLGIRTTPENVLITGGCQQALDLAAQALLNEGDTLLTTNPTYLGILDIARIRRVRAVGVPMDEQGLRTELLESAIEAHRPRLIYIAPTHHNPTGSVMPIHRRRVLLRIAAAADIPVLEDGVYHELSYGGEPPPPLKALDEYGIVVHANGFSKIVLPGTRIGYLIAEGALWERALRVKQAADICTPGLNQRAMHHFLISGALSGHLDRVRRACQQRRDAALKAARRYLPSGARWSEPPGGVYLWVALPHAGITAAQLYPIALRHGVSFAIGAEFYTMEGDPNAAYFIRLNFAQQPSERIEEGMRRLGAAWAEAQGRYGGSVG